MNRLRSIIATMLVVPMFIGMPAIAFAQLTPAGTGLQEAAAGSGLAGGCTGTDCLSQIVGQVINIVLGFLGIVLLAILIYAGFLWMTAGGDETKVKTARSTIVNAIAGLLVIAASYAITSFVISQLGSIAGGSSTSDAGTTGGGGTGAASGLPDGATCTSDAECASGFCQATLPTRTCATPVSL